MKRYKDEKHYRALTYDYSWDGYYFITICTKNKRFWFGEIKNAKMRLSEIGKIVQEELLRTPRVRKNITLDKWAIMPNHIHAIIIIGCNKSSFNISKLRTQTKEAKEKYDKYLNSRTSGPRLFGRNAPRRVPTGIAPLKKDSLSSIVNLFKGSVKRICNKNGLEYFAWQSRFYDHIVRDDKDLFNIREYIKNNPLNWELDRNYPENMEQSYDGRNAPRRVPTSESLVSDYQADHL